MFQLLFLILRDDVSMEVVVEDLAMLPPAFSVFHKREIPVVAHSEIPMVRLAMSPCTPKRTHRSFIIGKSCLLL